MSKVKLMLGNCLELAKTLESESVNCIVTSPPYWNLRDYGISGQFGNEDTPEEYICNLVSLFRELKRVLMNNGTAWVNLGDSYYGSGGAGGDYSVGGLREGQPKYKGTGRSRKDKTSLNLKPKDLCGIPWRVAFALQDDGWYLRSDIIWSKPNPMPESVTDRPVRSHEYIFLLSKGAKYYYDADAIREPQQQTSIDRARYKIGFNPKANDRPEKVSYVNQKTIDETRRKTLEGMGRNHRSVWAVTKKPFKGAHFATFPPELITPCILAGCPIDGWVLDPFMGSGTTIEVAVKHGRNGIGMELNPEYLYDIATPRVNNALADKGESARPLPHSLSQANAF